MVVRFDVVKVNFLFFASACVGGSFMKKTKHLIFLLLCSLFTVCFAFAARAEIVASGDCGARGDNLTWTLDDEGLLTISGEGAMADFCMVVHGVLYVHQ